MKSRTPQMMRRSRTFRAIVKTGWGVDPHPSEGGRDSALHLGAVQVIRCRVENRLEGADFGDLGLVAFQPLGEQHARVAGAEGHLALRPAGIGGEE